MNTIIITEKGTRVDLKKKRKEKERKKKRVGGTYSAKSSICKGGEERQEKSYE